MEQTTTVLEHTGHTVAREKTITFSRNVNHNSNAFPNTELLFYRRGGFPNKQNPVSLSILAHFSGSFRSQLVTELQIHVQIQIQIHRINHFHDGVVIHVAVHSFSTPLSDLDIRRRSSVSLPKGAQKRGIFFPRSSATERGSFLYQQPFLSSVAVATGGRLSCCCLSVAVRRRPRCGEEGGISLGRRHSVVGAAQEGGGNCCWRRCRLRRRCRCSVAVRRAEKGGMSCRWRRRHRYGVSAWVSNVDLAGAAARPK